MFDFLAYVQRRQAQPKAYPIRIQNYAYIKDIEHLREVSQNGLFAQAIDLGLQAWQFAEGKKLQRQARELGKEFERISLIWNEVCFQFEHSPLVLKIIPSQVQLFNAYGHQTGVFFGLSPEASGLPTTTLKFLFGRGLGALDNGHVATMTLARFFDACTRGFWQKATQLPDALYHWRRSAEITQDRAGILAARDISAAIFVIMRTTLDWDNAEILREIRRYHEKLDVDWGEEEVEKRIASIEVFMRSNLYVSGGIAMSEVDRQVEDLYRVF